ncbi:MAG: redoxin domain-containing protein [Rhodobacterales bacterium]|nr:redoxin domain-containing protein [Rhodobacterales bacterium]
MLEIGDSPAAFSLLDQDGNEVHWTDFRGSAVVLFAYPRAGTPGCTKEACAFRDLSAEFEATGTRVFGISADTVRKQSNFWNKHDLNMPLLADPEKRVLIPWGIWAEKMNYGRTYMGVVRSTFLFGPNGTLHQVWRNVRVKGHVDAVLHAAQKRSSAS